MVAEVGAGRRRGRRRPRLAPPLAGLAPLPGAATAGRDVWFGYGPVSGRMVQVIYHAHRRDGAGEVPSRHWPTCRATTPRPAIFELSCIVPASFRLTGQRLNAGDLSLQFTERLRDRDGPPPMLLSSPADRAPNRGGRTGPPAATAGSMARRAGTSAAGGLPPRRPAGADHPLCRGGRRRHHERRGAGFDRLNPLFPPAASGVLEGASFAAS